MKQMRARIMKKVCNAYILSAIPCLNTQVEVQTECNNSFEVSNSQYDDERGYESDENDEYINISDYTKIKNKLAIT